MKVYLSIAALTRKPPCRPAYDGRSVPPPPRGIRTGVRVTITARLRSRSPRDSGASAHRSRGGQLREFLEATRRADLVVAVMRLERRQLTAGDDRREKLLQRIRALGRHPGERAAPERGQPVVHMGERDRSR